MKRRKLGTVLRMAWGERWLVCEAILLLGLARVAVRTVPFRRLAPWLARAPESGPADPALLLRVHRAGTMAAHHVPWNAVCLPQAMAAKMMLARRGCGSSLHLGAGCDAHRAVTAHAWLAVEGTVVVGGAGRRAVTPLARFG